MRNLIIVATVVLCIETQAAEIRGSLRVVTTTNASVALVARTGQDVSYANSDDGSYLKGVTNPVPRFTVLAEPDQVRDNLTGLIWARDATMAVQTNWLDAIDYCENLVYGGTNDWRLPNIKELYSLVDTGHYNVAIPSPNPFTGLGPVIYWSSSTSFFNAPLNAWGLAIGGGITFTYDKTQKNFAWPVRGGQ